MVDRKWLPSDWLDESVPETADDPSQFLEQEPSGLWAVRLPKDSDDRRDDDEEGKPTYRIAVEPGQVVPFVYYESFGEIELTVHEDGTFTNGTVPPEATLFALDWETMADSLKDLAEKGDVGRQLDAGTYDVHAYHWSAPMSFRFEIDTTGAARFVLCAGAN